MATEEEKEIATEMTLQAFRTASDATNFRILERVGRAGATVSELEAASGLGRFATLERVTQLTQAGLVGRMAGSDRVEPTRLADGIVGLVEAVRDRFLAKLRDGLPALRGEDS